MASLGQDLKIMRSSASACQLMCYELFSTEEACEPANERDVQNNTGRMCKHAPLMALLR